MRRVLLILVVFILFFANVSGVYSLGQVFDEPNSQSDSLSNPIEDALKNIPGNKPVLVGVTCGQALSSPDEEATDVNKCCVEPKQFDAESSAINVLSNFMCLPLVASLPTRIIGGALGAINPINKVKGFAELFSGDILDGIGNITGLKSIFGAAQTATEPLCIGDITSGLANRLTQQKSFVKFQENISEAGVKPCQEGAIPSTNKSNKNCKCVQQTVLSLTALCRDYVSNPDQLRSCELCARRDGVFSSIGCIGTNPAGFVSTIMGVGVGLAGIAAFLCILYAAFILQTSQGNPDKIKKAREYLTNCIIGLLIILFAIFILRLIGVSILGIPGLS